ncbi:MAG: VIT1/CCC1 transporter family protein [Candidatus Bathyarchaeota archaeon]
MAAQQSIILSEEEIIEIAKITYIEEQKVATIYKKLGNRYKDPEISEKLQEISKAEETHTKFWKEFLEKRNENTEQIKPKKYIINILTIIYGILGIGLTLKILESEERKLIQQYSILFRSENLTPIEKTVITRFLLSELAHEEEFTEYEKKFQFFISKIATIFTQTSGGLVTVLSTAIGLSSIYDDPLIIGVTGLIVGLTGALNTIVGFYFFGRTSKKINEDIMSRIKTTCFCAPEAYMSRIEKYMIRRDYNEDIAKLIAVEAKEKNLIEKIIAEEEYGIKSISPNPMESALWAGLFKVVATVLPLMPFFFGLPVSVSIPVSVLITLVLLSIAGSLVAIAAEVSVWNKVVELISGGIVLASLTYILGKSASYITTILFKY